MPPSWESVLDRWAEAGLLDPATAARIRAWEASHARGGLRWPARLALGLAIFCAMLAIGLAYAAVQQRIGFPE